MNERMFNAIGDWAEGIIRKKVLPREEVQIHEAVEQGKSKTITLYFNGKVIGKKRFKFKRYYH